MIAAVGTFREPPALSKMRCWVVMVEAPAARSPCTSNGPAPTLTTIELKRKSFRPSDVFAIFRSLGCAMPRSGSWSDTAPAGADGTSTTSASATPSASEKTICLITLPPFKGAEDKGEARAPLRNTFSLCLLGEQRIPLMGYFCGYFAVASCQLDASSALFTQPRRRGILRSPVCAAGRDSPLLGSGPRLRHVHRFELLQDAQMVPASSYHLRNLAFGEEQGSGPHPPHPLARRGDGTCGTLPISLVGSAPAPNGGDLVALGDLLFDRKPVVREGGEQHLGDVPGAL